MPSIWREVYDRMPWRRMPTADNSAILTSGANALDLATHGPAPPELITPERRPTQPPTQGAEWGVSGTENFGGYIRREDFNPDLDNWQQAVGIYDKMRRGDAQIRSMLQVLKLPLRGATWAALPPLATGGDPVDQAIADFVNDCIFADDAMDDTWDSILRHILLQLDFGFS